MRLRCLTTTAAASVCLILVAGGGPLPVVGDDPSAAVPASDTPQGRITYRLIEPDLAPQDSRNEHPAADRRDDPPA